MELAHTNAVDFLYLSWLALLQTTLSKMSVGPIKRLGSEKLPEGVSGERSKMSLSLLKGLRFKPIDMCHVITVEF